MMFLEQILYTCTCHAAQNTYMGYSSSILTKHYSTKFSGNPQ